MKHGRGKFIFPDGSFLFGTWQDDRLNGLAKFKKKGESDFEFVIYKNDMQIKSAKGGLKCADICYILTSVFFMLGAYSTIPLFLITN